MACLAPARCPGSFGADDLAACSRMSATDFTTTDSIPMASNRQDDHHLCGAVTITYFAPERFAKPTLRATTFVNFL